MYTIPELKEKIVPVAKVYGVERVYLFGSYARGEASEKSDLDFRIDKGNIKGIQYFGFLNDLETILNMPVDMVTTNSLDKKFLEAIQREGEVLLYENKG
jgi:predicted nucleotidyltransferase